MEILKQHLTSKDLSPCWSDPHVLKNFGTWLNDHATSENFSTDLQRLWRKAKKERTVREVLFQEVLKTIDQILAAQKIPALIAKGPALAARYYQNPLYRHYSDIDIYIQSADWEKLDQAFRDNGFVLDTSSAKWEGTSFRQVYFAGQVPIEVHQGFLVRRDIPEAFSNSRAVALANINWLREPNAEILFVYLCGHGGFQHLFDELQWLLDLHLIAQTESLNWQRIFSLAKVLKLERALGVSLYLLKKYFASPVPSCGNRFVNFLYSLYLTPERILTRKTQSPRWLYLLFKAGMRDSLAEVFTYGVRRFRK